ncbi:uncharacterized protein LOC117107379 [Anneissia japonica]|uniref:uncharacterized protein LOC117107379 n=1 Tax=Anneissia japonica TaxID=1529436 RepID=UPI0014258607|nr:uncharacterized protein LOC117107379 [Anneissia japonica]
MEEHGSIETLSDWKLAVQQGVTIETLLGLSDNSQKKTNQKRHAEEHEERQEAAKAETAVDDFLTKLNVEINGTSLSFQLCCPQIPTAHPVTANQVLISPPSVPVSQLLSPCFVGVQNDKGDKSTSSGE